MVNQRVKLLLIGCAVFLVGIGLYFSIRSYNRDPLATKARAFKYNTNAYKTVVPLETKADSGEALTPQDIKTLEIKLNDPDWRIRARAMTALGHAGVEQAPIAAAIVRKKVNDPSPLTRLGALNALARLKAPDTKAVAKQLLSDPDQDVRKKAQIILAQEGT